MASPPLRTRTPGPRRQNGPDPGTSAPNWPKKRDRRDVLEQKKKLEDAQRDKEKRAAEAAVELEQMRAKALTWKHCPLTHRSERAVQGAARRSASSTLTINSLARDAVAENTAARTDKQKEKVGIEFVVDWLTVFAKVHHLDQVEELERIFYHGSGRKSRDGVSLTLEQLKASLADCSAYVHYRERRQQELAAQRREQEQAQGEEAAGGSVELPPP